MIAIILAAGKGTRLRPLSYFIPKILLPVRGEPVINHLMRNLEGIDLDCTYIIASESVDVIEDYIDKTNTKNVRVIRALGWETGGDLSTALEEIQPDGGLIVMNGDLITDIRISEMLQMHQERGPLCTISVFEINDMEEAKRFGSVIIDDDGLVTSFSEKNSQIPSLPARVNTGFYILDRNLMKIRGDYFSPRKFRLETEFFPRLAKERRLMGFVSKVSYWWDVGTISSYLDAERYLINDKKIIPP